MANVVCAVCGEAGNTVPYSMAGEHHKYGPRADHGFVPSTPADPYDAAIRYAQDRGAQDGRNAAEWYVQDAGINTRGGAHDVLAGIESGDPAVLDTFPFADLSGEWADTLTGPMLVRDAAAAAHGATGHYPHTDEWFSDICDAYETAFSDAVSAEIERAARAVLA
jgi:hypothetical protein